MAAQSDSAGIKFVNVASLFTVLKGSPIYAVCMRLETTVNDKKKIYIDKVGALMSVLENVLTGYLSQTSPEQTLLLFEFLHRHTLYLILHGDWGKHNAARQHMTFQFKRFESIAIRKNLPQVATSIRCLVDLLSDPWGNPTITKILNGESCSKEEVLRLIKAEMGIVLIVRLEIMAEARCDAQALALIEVCLECVAHPDNSQYFQQFSDEIVYIRDIYLVLLVRAKNNTKVLNEVNKMGLLEGLKLVRRCSKGERMVRLRKSHKKMADIVANMALTSAMIKPITEEEALHDLIEEWYNLYPDTQVLLRLLRKMIVNAVSSQHIYLLGRLLVEKYGQTEKLFCIELYIRALTVNLNELEKYKSNSEQEKVKESEVQLSNGFLLLADYLKDDILTCRECILTAFSLNPTRSCYERIKDLAVASGKLSSEHDDNCENNQSSINCEKHSLENHDPGMKIDTGQPNGTEPLNHESQSLLTQQIAQLSFETREKQMKINETVAATESGKNVESKCDILSSPIHISDAQKIGIPQNLCDDLTTVISSARYQVLNWHLDWSELSSRCESYIISGKEHRSTEKELKYLNIDYNQFKDWPRDKMYDTGIEKGFEEFVESDSAEETDTSSEPPKRRQSKQSMDDETQDSLDFGGKIQVKSTKTTLSSNLACPEFVTKTAKKQERIKRKALLSISDTEIVVQDRLPGSVGGNEGVVERTKSNRKKTKIQKPDRKSRSLLKQPRPNFEVTPQPLHFSPYGPPDLLDIVSIEEDASRVSFSPIITTEEYLSLLKINKGTHKSHDITSTLPSDNTATNKNNLSQTVNNQATKTASSTEKPNYCIAENDLSITSSLSPFCSPSKLSDPTVLKSLRMYRSKKSGPESLNGSPEKQQERCRSLFPPMLSTVDLNPRILSRSKIHTKTEVINIEINSENTKPEVISLDGDSEPEIIDLVDDDEEEDNNMNTINSSCYTSKIPYDVTSKMKLNFDSVLKSKSANRKSAFSKPNSINDLARNLGLKSVDMIRPATTETTVQVVQLSSSVRSLVTSNSNTNPNTTMIQTMAQQTTSSSLGQASSNNLTSNITTVIYTMPHQSPSVTSSSLGQASSNNLTSNITTVIYTMPHQSPSVTSSSLGQASSNNLTSNITTVIYTMPHQSTSVTFAQVSNNTLVSNSSILYTMPQQTSTAAQVRSTTALMTSDTSSKPVATNNTTLPSRILSSTGSQASITNAPSSFATMSSPARHFYSAPRQIFPQNQGVYVSRQSPERVLLSPTVTNQSSSINIRRNTPSPRETVVANTETANVPINVIRVERISIVPSSESNQPMPNLSPIKNPVSSRPQPGCVSRQQLFMRNNVSRATTNTSTQSHPVVTSSRGQTNLPSTVTSSTLAPSRSMPVTAHIQRVGYPPETSQSGTGVQLKYIFKEGVLSSTNEKHVEESEGDSNSVAMVLSSEQIQQLLPKSTSQDKSTSDQDDNRTQGASLPKFQQAFGRTMYQNSSTPSGNTSSSESPALNFVQQIQPSNASTDNVTSSICTVLSKAVQTTTKDSEVSNKSSVQSNITNEHSNHRKLSLTGNTSTSATVQTVAVSTATTPIETQLTSSNTHSKTRTNERSTLLQQTPVKILTLAGTNLLQGKSVAILKTSVPPEKLAQAQVKYEGDNRSKETVIRSNMSNMSALLAAALQAQQPQLRQVSSGINNPGVSAQVHLKTSQDLEKKKLDQVNSTKNQPQKSFRKLPVQNQPSSRYTKPLLQVSSAGGNQNVTSSTPVVTIPIRTVLATGQQTTAPTRLSTERVEVRSENLVSPSPPEDPSGSSLLDQQLKEFESVFNKVKKTSQMKERTNSTTVQIQPHLSLGQQILLTQPSSSSNVEFTNTSTNQTALFQSTSTSTIHDLQGERVSLTFISQPATGATNTLIPGTSQKITSATPVVVVQSCSKPVTSPALSVTSQSSSSPAPPSTPGSSSGKMSTTAIVKQNKSNKSKTATKTTPTTTLKVSTLPKPQQKPQEDEQTTQRIYAILDKYAEQLRNSPELKNKPAPRRRSNPPTNPNQNSKRKKSTQTKSKLPSQQASCSSSGMEMSPGSEDMRTIGSEDSSNGVSQLSQTLNSPQSRQDDPSTPTGDVSSSESLDSRDTRIQSRVVLAETSTGQSRTVIVQDNVPTQVLNVDASKLLPGKPVVVASQTIVPQLVLPTNVAGVQKMQLFPVPTDGRPFVVTKLPKAYRVHQVTMPRGAPSLLAPGAVVRIPMCGTSAVKQVKLPVSGISTQNLSNVITSGSHTFTVTHDSGLDINLDNAILLNSTPQQSISFVHRSVPSSSYQSQDSSIGTSTTVTASPAIQKTTVAYSTSDINVGYIKHEFKQESGNTLPICSQMNVIPVSSSSQDTKPTTSNVTCITLDDDIDYPSTDRRPSVTSDVSTLVISQASGDNKLWRTSDSNKSLTSEVKRESGSQDFSGFQPSKTALGHRSLSTSSFLSEQDHFMDSKKLTEKDVNMDSNHDLELKEEVKPERVMQEPELCDESVSSDSAGSGRVKIKSEEKSHLMPESSQDTGSPWPYNVTKIECIVKSDSPNTSVKQGETGLTHSQGNIYKKKSNNVENTIYQMAFKRTDRSKISKEHAAALERNIQLQKSLSEECEDLGVEEPSTNDLFPEAELLLDPDHSSHDSQIDLPSETFSQTLNSSSSSDSRAMSPMFPVAKRPVTYKCSQKSQLIANKTNRFTPIFNPVYQFTEESTSGTVSSTRPDSPDCQIISYKFLKGQTKLGSNSESNSPLMTKSLGLKGNVSPMVLLPKTARDQHKSSSSGASTPVNGGESMASPNNDELPNSYTSEETQCTQKTSDDNCKDTEVETTTDSDSNIEALNVTTCQDNSLDNKSSFIPIPNPAASSPFTYGGNRSSLKMSSRKVQMKHEIWKSILRGSDGKEDLDSDMSDPDQVRISDKRSTSTDEDLQSEGEARAKNGLGTESEETQSASDRNTRSTKKSRKRSGPLIKCSPSKSKVPRRVDAECVDEIISELATPSNMCKNASSHHDSSSRRSSLRGHIKKNCACCNGSTERPTKTLQKTEKLSVSSPSPSTLVLGLSKKKSSSKSSVKTSHISKKR